MQSLPVHSSHAWSRAAESSQASTSETSPIYLELLFCQLQIDRQSLAMRSAVVFASLFVFLLLTGTRVHGVRRLETHRHAALSSKYQEDTSDSIKWQHPSAAGRPMYTNRKSDGRGGSVGGGPTPEHLTAHGRRRRRRDEVGTTMRARAVAPRVHDEDYVGPSGHSPNHHRTNPCGPCT